MPLRRQSRRGVWKVPGRGPHGETYLFVLDYWGRHVTAPVTVPAKCDPFEIGQGLWNALDSADPQHRSTVGAASALTRVPRSGHLAGLRLVAGRA